MPIYEAAAGRTNLHAAARRGDPDELIYDSPDLASRLALLPAVLTTAEAVAYTLEEGDPPRPRRSTSWRGLRRPWSSTGLAKGLDMSADKAVASAKAKAVTADASALTCPSASLRERLTTCGSVLTRPEATHGLLACNNGSGSVTRWSSGSQLAGTRVRRSPMPAVLWEEAVRLGQQLGVHPVKVALGLNYESLRQRVADAAKSGSSAPRFIELTDGIQLPTVAAAAIGSVVEIAG
jgi:hypothetical protein